VNNSERPDQRHQVRRSTKSKERREKREEREKRERERGPDERERGGAVDSIPHCTRIITQHDATTSSNSSAQI
jgi:hypothetical protein